MVTFAITQDSSLGVVVGEIQGSGYGITFSDRLNGTEIEGLTICIQLPGSPMWHLKSREFFFYSFTGSNNVDSPSHPLL